MFTRTARRKLKRITIVLAIVTFIVWQGKALDYLIVDRSIHSFHGCIDYWMINY